jgi:hypothetical protein
MRKNLTKAKIQAGETAYGVFVNVSNPSLVEIVGHLGFDFALIDAEHGPMGLESCEQMIRAADAVNITPLVRIAMNVQQNILRFLDMGALGVQLPLLNTKEDRGKRGTLRQVQTGRQERAGRRQSQQLGFGRTDGRICSGGKPRNHGNRPGRDHGCSGQFERYTDRTQRRHNFHRAK